jgi:hypothetical protein
LANPIDRMGLKLGGYSLSLRSNDRTVVVLPVELRPDVMIHAHRFLTCSWYLPILLTPETPAVGEHSSDVLFWSVLWSTTDGSCPHP